MVFVLLQIKTPPQLDAAFSFLTATASDNLKVGDFEAACGVGTTNLMQLQFRFVYQAV